MRRVTTELEGPKSVGELVRARRKALGLTQERLAELANVGTRFVRELEQGKPTAEIGRVMKVLTVLGLRLQADYVTEGGDS